MAGYPARRLVRRGRLDVIVPACAGPDVHQRRVLACRITPEPTAQPADGVVVQGGGRGLRPRPRPGRIPRPLKRGEPKWRGLKRVEQLRLLNAAQTLRMRKGWGSDQGLRNHALTATLLGTGLRVSGLLAIDVAQYNQRGFVIESLCPPFRNGEQRIALLTNGGGRLYPGSTLSRDQMWSFSAAC
jgi:hypothetical protein